MKICVLLSSYDGTGKEYADVTSDYRDPSYWDEYKRHIFTLKYLTKKNAIDVIKESVVEGYDFIWNFLWGLESYSVAGIEAVQFLESTKHPMLGTSSKFMSLSKVAIKEAVKMAGVLTPKWTTDSNFNWEGMSYPVIVKASDGYCSVHTKKSICTNEEEVQNQVIFLKSQTDNPCKDVLIEEFILGHDYSCMVLETVDGAIPLRPIFYFYPAKGEDLNPNLMDPNLRNSGQLAWRALDWEAKCAPLIKGAGRGKEIVGYRVVTENEISKKVQETSVKAFMALGVAGSGYARVDLRVRGQQVYILEVNHTPAFFCPKGNLYGDDDVLLESFPGQHTALVEALIANKRSLLSVERFYNDASSFYDSEFSIKRDMTFWKDITKSQDFSGSVLDLGCGTGYLGKLISESVRHPKSVTLNGIDACEKMTARAEGYSNIHIGLIENVLGDLVLDGQKFDHIVGYGVFLLQNPAAFEKTLELCFKAAKISITLTVENVDKEYIDGMRDNFIAYNNVGILTRFKMPVGWSELFSRNNLAWTSPTIGAKIYTFTRMYRKTTSYKPAKN